MATFGRIRHDGAARDGFDAATLAKSCRLNRKQASILQQLALPLSLLADLVAETNRFETNGEVDDERGRRGKDSNTPETLLFPGASEPDN